MIGTHIEKIDTRTKKVSKTRELERYGKEKERPKGREEQDLWSSGCGRRFMFKRSWVQIPSPDTGQTFCHINFQHELYFCLKRHRKQSKKRPGMTH